MSIYYNLHLQPSLARPFVLMSKTKSYAQILIGSWLFLTAMAIHLSIWVAPLDLQQGGNSRILYVHVPVARMSILVYIVTAITTINKTSSFSSLFRNRYRNGCFFYLSYWGVSGKTHVGHLLGVGCSFNFCIHLVPYLLGCTVFSKAFCRTGSYFNPCWTDRYTNNKVSSQLVEYIASTWEHSLADLVHQSIHVPMPIPILSNFANFLFSTRIFFVLETRLQIPSFLEFNGRKKK